MVGKITKEEYVEVLDGFLLQNISVFEYGKAWAWGEIEDDLCHGVIVTDKVKYSSREKCLKACLFQLKNSTKIGVAKAEANEYLRYNNLTLKRDEREKST